MPAKKAPAFEITFAPLKAEREDVTCFLVARDLVFSEIGREANEDASGGLEKAAKAAGFSGKAKTTVEVLAPYGLKETRVILLGAGDPAEAKEDDWVLLGGTAAGQILARKAKSASIVAQLDAEEPSAVDLAANLAFGAQLRHYNFRKYQSKATKDEESEEAQANGLEKLVIHCAEPKKAEKAFARLKGIAEGVHLARDLVNEPANELGPVEFAERAQALEDVGVKVEVLDVEDLKKLKMNALLGVAQGSERPARVVVMRWQGGKKDAPPVAFIGKGVVFDTGGISIKPAQGMEDMKGDMGGAACVVGLMYALGARKAKVNAIGIIGCVENMPSGTAQRPGDIVRSMSGQTIEVLNTDAEGRLVLADILWYAQERFKPKLLIDLATLTGAIMIALGKEYAGLYSNNDALVDNLLKASKETGEKIWRMPLDKAYDKLIDSKNADVKNLGGRWGGACTAAQFIQRFVKDKDTPWAHIDLAGTAMDSGRNAINQSWGSGWGVRLLDRFVANEHEG